MRKILMLLIATMTALTACGDTGSTGGSGTATLTSTSEPAPPTVTTGTPTKTAATGAGIVVKTASSEFGEMLFDESGQAIYLFDKETSSRPECYDDCATAWPPVLTDGAPRAATGTRPELLGTTTRTDGSVQVTYADHPLYYYADEGKNEVKCHKVTGFGGLWLVVTPSGAPAG